jgi:glycerol-3-phosphate dehydrogenase
VFAIPHGPVTYLGTTDTEYPEIADYPNVTWEDVEYLFDAANRTFDLATPLGPEDLVNAWAGLRPLLHQEGKKPTELSRQDEVMVNDAGLISIAGGKLTTFRRMAERVTDMVCARLVEGGQTLPPPVALSDQDPLSGGETGTDLARFEDYLASRVRDVKREGVERLVRLYGSNATSIVDAMERDPNHARQYSHDCLLTPAEVEYNLKYEMALTLQDVLERRTRLLLWDLQCGMSVAERVSTTLAESLGWDEARRQREVAEYQRLVDWLKTPTGAKEAAEEPQAMHG